MKPQSCKAKGRRLQQLIVEDLLSIFPHLTEDDIRSTSMGANGEDIQLSAAARLVLPFSFEAKNQERINVWSALQQSRANAPHKTDPVVVVKKNKEKPHVLISWDLFQRLIGPSTQTDMSTKSQLLLLSSELQRLATELSDE